MRSKMLLEFTDGESSIIQTLTKLIIVLTELGNRDIEKWIRNELNGYGCSDKLPDYRKGLPYRILYTGFNGRFQLNNQPLPISSFGKFADEISSLNRVYNGLFELEQQEEITLSMDLTPFAHEVLDNTGISCVSISLEMSSSVKDIIISSVRTKTIDIMLYLEKEFGNLDDLYSGNTLMDPKKVNEVGRNLQYFIYSDGEII